MKQEQTIDDILKLLKDSINDESPKVESMFDASDKSDKNKVQESISEEDLKARLQKQYGEQTTEFSENLESITTYTLDENFLQETIEEIEPDEEILEPVEEIIEEIEEVVNEEAPLAIDYDDADEEIEYELLPKLGSEAPTGVILRNQSTEAVPVGEPWGLYWETENEITLLEGKDEDPLLFGLTDTTPALAEQFGNFEEFEREEENDSAYELMRQFDCEDEWQSEDLPLSALEEEEEDTPDAFDDTLFFEYQKKKKVAILRMVGGAILSILLFFYETLPLFGVPFVGILNYREYIGAYLLIGFQLLFLSTLMFGKRMGEGALRIFSLRPNIYSIAALSVMGVLLYDVIALFTMQSWIAPFHFAVSLFLLMLSWSEYLFVSREMKILFVIFSDCERTKYTLHSLDSENPYVEKMMRGGLSENANVAVPVRCEVTKEFFKEACSRSLGVRMASILLLPALLLSLVTAIVTILLNWSLSETLLTAISMLLVTLPIGTVLVVSFPLWFSATKLSNRQIALSGCAQMEDAANTDVLIFEDMHLFRKCTTEDTGIAVFEKQQTAQILGCLECLYSRLGGPLSEAFSNLPEQYRFQMLAIRRLTNGGVEAMIERKHCLLVGDAEFMKRYGLKFPRSEEKTGRTTVYISLDGKISAKMSVRYQPEPIFEMLVERMYQEGTQCVIKTFDPMISATRISSLRSMGCSPISVIHQSMSDLSKNESTDKQTQQAKGMIAVASRFKLIEALSWARALGGIRRANHRMLAVISVLGLVAIGVLMGFGKIHWLNQYWIILWGALAQMVAILITFIMAPSKQTFSLDSYRQEWKKRKLATIKKQKGKNKFE